jgi:poly(beta-D-mannuronate) lyase
MTSSGGTGGWHPKATGAEYPSELINLSQWRLELPVDSGGGTDGDARIVEWPDLDEFEFDPYFDVTADTTAVVFRAHAGGATTEKSSYPRCELREMNGAAKAAWSTSSGFHSITITQRITHAPPEKPHVVAGQIHDSEDDVIMIRYEGDSDDKLFVEAKGESWGALDKYYELGDWFTVRVEASSGQVRVYYDDELRVEHAASCTDGCYFKAGCYTQSNTEAGDEASAFGQVEISSLTISHDFN